MDNATGSWRGCVRHLTRTERAPGSRRNEKPVCRGVADVGTRAGIKIIYYNLKCSTCNDVPYCIRSRCVMIRRARCLEFKVTRPPLAIEPYRYRCMRAAVRNGRKKQREKNGLNAPKNARLARIFKVPVVYRRLPPSVAKGQGRVVVWWPFFLLFTALAYAHTRLYAVRDNYDDDDLFICWLFFLVKRTTRPIRSINDNISPDLFFTSRRFFSYKYVLREYLQ